MELICLTKARKELPCAAMITLFPDLIVGATSLFHSGSTRSNVVAKLSVRFFLIRILTSVRPCLSTPEIQKLLPATQVSIATFVGHTDIESICFSISIETFVVFDSRRRLQSCAHSC